MISRIATKFAYMFAVRPVLPALGTFRTALQRALRPVDSYPTGKHCSVSPNVIHACGDDMEDALEQGLLQNQTLVAVMLDIDRARLYVCTAIFLLLLRSLSAYRT